MSVANEAPTGALAPRTAAGHGRETPLVRAASAFSVTASSRSS